ncbi:probable phosphopantothenoylcysteine decarboxylase isoform X2 [Arachis ipaensis]|uniref:probable phosphopantothenoylcysteine decarboxylase isoform X2 n=1 Tax=Arachis ipaensis TaxID=130454 RepID=UPI000A2AF954|nr:probable phosphopantothenoylcysteine decarboxylase isoform X2 [Arachis ipaensis]
MNVFFVIKMVYRFQGVQKKFMVQLCSTQSWCELMLVLENSVRNIVAFTGLHLGGHRSGEPSVIPAVDIESRTRLSVMASSDIVRGKTYAEAVAVYMDDDQWILWENKEVLCLHAELCMWADAVVIAPLSVHALGKFAGGYCDTLLTSVVRAWNCAKKPLFVVSCMDPLWKENYITLRNYNHTGNSEARWENA